jgi:hypothetical protein
VREEQVARARNGTAQLDHDLARLRELLGDRYDQIRDRLPELLERYGDLRDSRAVKAVLRDWRLRRLHASSASVTAPSGDADSSDGEPAAADKRDPILN